MKRLISASILIFTLTFSFGQELADLQNELKSIKAQLIALKKDEWEQKKNEISSAIEISIRTTSVFNEYNTQIADQSQLLTNLLEATNPTSAIFGNQSYTDIVIKKAEEHFVNSITDPNSKQRFKDVITNIASSPLLTAVVGSNPVGALVSSVVNTAATFLTTTKTGGVLTSAKNEINKERIDKFVKEINPLIEYYSALSRANENFRSNLAMLEIDRKKLSEAIPGIRAKLLLQLNLIDDPNKSMVSEFNNKYNDTGADYNKYVNLLSQVELASNTAKTIKQLDLALNEYKKSYSKVVAKLVSDSKEALARGRSYAESRNLDASRIVTLLNNLNNLSNESDPAVKVLKSSPL